MFHIGGAYQNWPAIYKIKNNNLERLDFYNIRPFTVSNSFVGYYISAINI